MADTPTVGGDKNTWGTKLNAFLGVSHETSGANGGKVKSDAIINVPTGTISATNNQAAINEIVSDNAASSGSSLIGHLPLLGTVPSTVQSQLRKIVRISDFASNSLNAAVAAIGSTPTTLYIDVAATCTGPLTTPKTLSIVCAREGSINVVSGTLTIDGSFDAGLYQVFSGSGTVIFGGDVELARPCWWTNNDVPGTTDMTSAIDKAIASGRNVYINGIHGTTGRHRLSATNQGIYGENDGTFKKLSGTNYIIDTTHGAHRVSMRDLRFNGNSLDGIPVIWRAHYSTLKDIYIENHGGTAYGMKLSGVNVSHFENIAIQNGYAGLLIDQTGDTGVSPTPTYGCLYTTFDNIILVPLTGSALKLAGSQSQILTFNDMYIETAGYSLAVPTIHLTGSTLSIYFNNLRAEYGTLSTAFMVADSVNVIDIHINGGRIFTGVSQDITIPMFDYTNTNNYTIKNLLFLNPIALEGRNYIKLTGTRQGIIESNIVISVQNFSFINDVSGNSYITERNNGHSIDDISWSGKGTNTWTSAAPLTIDGSSQFVQIYSTGSMRPINANVPFYITVADDAYYEIHGDGGTNAAGDFSGIVTMGIRTPTTTSKDNIALFYAQVSSGPGTKLHTNISVGSNVEILDNADNVGASLSLTTDGKLGVQIGYLTTAKRYVRVYNRTGASISLFVKVERFG